MSVGHDASRAWRLDDGAIVQSTVSAALPFLHDGKRHVISLVGGGGKSTTLHYLAAQYAASGMKTAVTTTTKIGRPTVWCESPAQWRGAWDTGCYAVCGKPFGAGKLDALPEDAMQQLLSDADIVLIEADGARRMPCKAPAEHEPVIRPESDIVLAIMGLDACGCPLEDACFRPEIVADILGADARHVLSPADMAALLLSERGSRKQVDSRDFYAVLNKCDTPQRQAYGTEILHLLQGGLISGAILTTGMPVSEQFEYAKMP